MGHRTFNSRQARQRGQTLVLVTICLVAMISMAALAIDVTALYVARGETQRAADAAALAAAKAFVDSGTTTAPLDTNLQGLARTMGTAFINSLLAQNKVGGTAPQLASAPTFDFSSHVGNPQVTVTLQRTDVPTFFAHIFGQRLATVRASATAEAYNSSQPPGGGSGMPPVAPACVKPWLIPNADPRHSRLPFITASGAIQSPGVSPLGIIGEQITLLNGCDNGLPICVPPLFLPPLSGPTNPLDPHFADGLAYLPAQLAAATGTCPSCAGGTDFEKSSACCDTGNTSSYSCGASAPGILMNLATNIVNNTISSVECLIGATGPGPGAGQDEIGLGPGAQPPANTFGNFLASNGNDPIEIRSGSGPHIGQIVSTSPSIVTLPIYDNTGSIPLVGSLLGPVKIIGFMQAFVESKRVRMGTL